MIEVLNIHPNQTDAKYDQDLSNKPGRYIKNRVLTQRRLIDEKLKESLPLAHV